MKKGDILLDFDDLPIFSVERLQWLVASKAVGDKVSIEYLRDDERKSADVTLGSWSQHTSALTSPARMSSEGGVASYIGVYLQDLSVGLRDYFSAPVGVGMLVAEVKEDAAAADAGLIAGDVIISMGNKVIRDMGDVRRVLNFFDPGERVVVELMRSKEKIALDVTVGSRSVSHAGTEMHGAHHFDHSNIEGFDLHGSVGSNHATHHEYMFDDMYPSTM